MKISKRRLFNSSLVALAAIFLLVSCENANKASSEKSWPSIEEAKAIAEEGFIYGLPIVMNYAVMYNFSVDKNSGQFKAPFNQIKNHHEVFTWRDTTIVTPNSDTPYSLVWLDLAAEPMVLSVPEIEKNRYYSVHLVDGNTFNYGFIGTRTTGNAAGNYMVVGPEWNGQTPEGIEKVFQSSTRFSLCIFRTQLFNPGDIDNVIKVQEGYKAQPLSAFLNQPAPEAAPAVEFPVINNELVSKNFFEYLDFALQFAPAGPEEKEIRAKLAKIGVGPGKSFDFKELPDAYKLEIGLGMKEGDSKIDQYLSDSLFQVNGWDMSSLMGNRAFFNGNWMKRAAGAKAGIYGLDSEEAAYPMIRTLASGETIDCSKYNYTLTFAKDEYPPVNAFWSITMYDGKTQFLIKNPIDRYLINSPMLPELKKNKDGSLTIYIQKDTPGKEKEPNWLPAPDGPVYMVMRLYWPKTEAPSVLPIGEGTWKPAPVVKVN